MQKPHAQPSELAIDESIAESFPASDPPALDLDRTENMRHEADDGRVDGDEHKVRERKAPPKSQ